MILSLPAAGYVLGSLLPVKSSHPVIVILCGTALLYFICLLPIVGSAALVTSSAIGTGMLVQELFDRKNKTVKTDK